MRERIAEPEVRIHSPPAMSLRTIGSGAIVQRIHPQHRNPKRCEHGLTPRVVELGPKRRHSPPGSGGVTPKLRWSALRARGGTEGSNPFPPAESPRLTQTRPLQVENRGFRAAVRCSVGGAVGRGAPCPCSARHRRAGASQGLRQPMGSHADPLRAGQEHRVRQASGRCRAIHMGRTVPVSKQDIQIIR